MGGIGTQEGRSQRHVSQCGGKTDPGQGPINDHLHTMHEGLQLLASLAANEGM
ncbi:hypothetical protein D3C85_1037770 [compost metagenome]